MTKLENLIDPEVMAPMISAKLTKAIKVTPFAKIDNTVSKETFDKMSYKERVELKQENPELFQKYNNN
jgi:hypothetical protein